MIRFRTLKADEIECRVKQSTEKGAMILLYKDARCDMNILDETVGEENWQRDHKELKGNIYGGIGINVNYFDSEVPMLWVWKWDAGSESNTEAEKGEASDSFKRAGFNWGIGRELYTAPFIWIKSADCKKLYQDDNKKWHCNDKFSVRDIGYYERKIDYLVIDNGGVLVYTFGEPDPTKRMRKHLLEYCMRNGIDESEVAERFSLSKESTREDFEKALNCLKGEHDGQ